MTESLRGDHGVPLNFDVKVAPRLICLDLLRVWAFPSVKYDPSFMSCVIILGTRHASSDLLIEMVKGFVFKKCRCQTKGLVSGQEC